MTAGTNSGCDTDTSSSDSPPSLITTTETTSNTAQETLPLAKAQEASYSFDGNGHTLFSKSKGSKDWDVVGLNISESQRLTFLGLLEGKTQAYADLAHSMPSIDQLEFTENLRTPPLVDADRLMFKNLGQPRPSFYQHVNAPNSIQNQLVMKFRESLFPDNGTVPEALKNHARLLSHLPPLTGTNPLLDTSVRAVTLVHIGRLNNSEPFIMESRPYYGQALRLLNKALQDRKHGTSNETLCAVILLSFYEMFASDNNESWIRHAGGVSALMRARGPGRHRYGFDREIYLAYRYTLVIEAFQERMPCFLAEATWLKLSKDIHADLKAAGVAASRIEIFDMADEFYSAMVVLPELTAQAQSLFEAWETKTTPQYSRAHVLDRLIQGRVFFKSTFARLEAALKKAGHAPTINLTPHDPLIGIEYDFVNTFIAASYTGYWTVLMVLNLCLQALQANDADMIGLYRTESRECGLNVCRSTTSMLTSSFLGPFFLIFGLRVGLLVFEDQIGPGEEVRAEANWILRKLFDIGERHMGIAKHIPGYRAGMTVDELLAEFRAQKKKATQDNVQSGQTDFARQVVYGETEPHQSSDRTQSAWQDMTKVEDVLKVWDEQDNFQLQQNMDNLDVGHDATGFADVPASSTFHEQQFPAVGAAQFMPDMNFFDRDFFNMPSTNVDPFTHDDLMTASMEDLPSQQQDFDAYNDAEVEAQTGISMQNTTIPGVVQHFPP